MCILLGCRKKEIAYSIFLVLTRTSFLCPLWTLYLYYLSLQCFCYITLWILGPSISEQPYKSIFSFPLAVLHHLLLIHRGNAICHVQHSVVVPSLFSPLTPNVDLWAMSIQTCQPFQSSKISFINQTLLGTYENKARQAHSTIFKDNLHHVSRHNIFIHSIKWKSTEPYFLFSKELSGDSKPKKSEINDDDLTYNLGHPIHF